MTVAGYRVLRAAVAATAALSAVLIAAPPAQADQTRDTQWHLGFLRMSEAHKISQGEGVTVAVVDTGVDARHPDLAGAVLPGADFVPGGDGAGSGRTDIDGHGTAMAGLIAARGHGTGDGALGIAPKSKILPVRHGTGNLGSNPVDSIRWAVEHGAKVICMAFVGTSSRAEKEAVDAALRADVVLVAGAGNLPGANIVGYPAAYPGVVAVSGVDRKGRHAAVSVTGPEVVLSAPAEQITSIGLGSQYRSGTGTSDATAIVAGVAALVRAKYPDLSAAEVVHRMTETAQDKGAAGRDDVFGYGIVDPVAALTASVSPLPASSATQEKPVGTPPVVVPPDDSESPVMFRVLLVGSGCLLLVIAVVVVIWLLVRRRRPRVG